MKYTKLYAAFLMIICLANLKALGQSCGPFAGSTDNCTSASQVVLPGPFTICAGGSVNVAPVLNLPPLFTVQSYTWTPTTGVAPSATGLGAPSTVSITPSPVSPPSCGLAPVTYGLNVTTLGPNAIVNGDLSLGNVDFCTNFVYSAPGTVTAPTTIFDMGYSVCSNTNQLAIFGAPTTSFTPYGSCPNMIVYDLDNNESEYWTQKVVVCPGATYQFSCEMANLLGSPILPGASAMLFVTITDAMGGITSYPTLAGLTASYSPAGVWTNNTMTWTNPSTTAYTTATISITSNNAINPWATLVALDDMKMQRVSTASATTTVNVDYVSITPPPGPYCIGNTYAFSSCTTGGNWSSSNTAVAAIDASGNVTANATGSSTISYTDIYGCTATTTINIAAPPHVTGTPNVVCFNYTGIISLSATPSGGAWTPGYPFLSAGSPGTFKLQSGLPPYFSGVYDIYYTAGPGSCMATFPITVNPAPKIGTTISYMCIGDYISLSASPAGGTWSTTDPTVVHVDPVTGVITGLSGTTSGTLATIVYTTPCGVALSTVWVYDCSSGVVVGGGGKMCCTGYRTLTGLPAGGTWTSSDAPIVNIDPHSGYIFSVCEGLTAPTPVTFTYTSGSTVITTTITVYPLPVVAAITGPTTTCGTGTTALSDATTGGVWALTPTTTATIDPATGVITPVSSTSCGPVDVSYTVTNDGGCATAVYYNVNICPPASACLMLDMSLDEIYMTSVTGCATSVTFQCFTPLGVLLYDPTSGSSYFTATVGSYISQATLPVGTYYICLVSVYNGCTWPANCCMKFMSPSSRESHPATAATTISGPMAVIPNPNKGVFTLKGDVPGSVVSKDLGFEIVDMLGRVVYEDVATIDNGAINKNIALDENVANGLYLVKIKDDHINQVIRFSLNR